VKREALFRLEGPIWALDLGEGRTSMMCPRCGRADSVQVGEFAVELVCETKGVGKSDISTVLVEAHIADEIERSGEWDVRSRRVRAQWREDLTIANTVPDLRQLIAEHPIQASSASVEFEDCECGSVSRIYSDPLIVREPGTPNAGVWFLGENPRILIIGDRLRTLLVQYNASLEFTKVYYEGEYRRPTPTFDGISWEDLN